VISKASNTIWYNNDAQLSKFPLPLFYSHAFLSSFVHSQLFAMVSGLVMLALVQYLRLSLDVGNLGSGYRNGRGQFVLTSVVVEMALCILLSHFGLRIFGKIVHAYNFSEGHPHRDGDMDDELFRILGLLLFSGPDDMMEDWESDYKDVIDWMKASLKQRDVDILPVKLRPPDDSVESNLEEKEEAEAESRLPMDEEEGGGAFDSFDGFDGVDFHDNGEADAPEGGVRTVTRRKFVEYMRKKVKRGFEERKRMIYRSAHWIRSSLGPAMIDQISIVVNRESVLTASMASLHLLAPWKARRFRITFEEEEGIDAGGLLREWYHLCTAELFNSSVGLFEVANADGSNGYNVSHYSSFQENHLAYFRFAGRLFGRALLDRMFIPVHLQASFYKLLRGDTLTIRDINREDTSLYNGLEFMLHNDVGGTFFETFSVDFEKGGELLTHDLIPNGQKIPVTGEFLMNPNAMRRKFNCNNEY
jgi:hypothetical protein